MVDLTVLGLQFHSILQVFFSFIYSLIIYFEKKEAFFPISICL